MGSSNSTSGSQRRLKFPDNMPRVEYIKNFNNQGDSDYDDEDDSKIEDDASNSELAPAIGDAANKPSLHSKEGAKMFDDLKDEDEEEDGQLLAHNQSENVINKTEPKFKKVFENDNSVAQLDKQSSVASARPSDIQNGSFNSSPSPRIRKGKKSSDKNLDGPKDDGPSEEPEQRGQRTIMDPQQKQALEEDLERLKSFGEMKFNKVGLLSFNRFMHIFILITRHSKEQFIKEQRKVIDKRRQAFKLKDWKKYAEVVQHELDMEKLKYLDVINYILEYFQIPDGCYKASFMKYSLNRDRDLQMKDARQMIIMDVMQKQIDNTEFNEEMIERDQCVKILGYYEARKLDVLSILSNPFKHQFDQKDKFVLELAIEQAKIEDQIYQKYGKEFRLFIKACRYYGLLKSRSKTAAQELNRDALIIQNNLNNIDF